ncbi:MAG: endonuclease, partial [Rhodanobacteraceae bacterium]|nr:endonuclease [Rhodanobacteraceae bacterium]
PPTVASTSPANSAASVPVGANLIVNFSEPVSVSGSWYSISCAVSGAHTGVVTGGPATYTINPAPDFDALESCTVTLTAALILDQDGTPDPLTANYVWTFTTAAGSGDYYASVNASTAALLRSTLHALIDDHVAYPYTGPGPCNPAAPTPTTCDTWDILDRADQNPGNTNEIIDVYQNDRHPKAGGGNTNYNREHTWPNSLGFNNLDGLDGNGNPYSPYTDTHMLYLADISYNSNRGNKPYDNCIGCTNQDPTVANNGVGGQGGAPFPGDSNWWDGANYRTWSARKGDVARAVLYMDVRYEGGNHANGQPEPDLIVTNIRAQIQGTAGGVVAPQGYMGILDTLLEWHFADPPDAQEILRNSVIQGFQGNRNPFIDHPEWAACLWQNNCAPATVPDAPTSPVATAGHQRVTVAFTPPVNNGGSAITSYTATCGGQSQSGPASPITVTGLTNGVQVTCTVVATNSVGNSLPSGASNAVTPAPTAPDAPTAVVATRGDGQVIVAFSPPLNDGGSAVQNYTATCGTQSGIAGASPVVVLGLTNGVPVSCTVVATNGIGNSQPSLPSNTVTPAGAPGAPTNVVATAGNAQVSVAFGFPNANGSTITSYTAQCTGSTTFSGPTSPIVVTGLTNGTPVSCTVFATNGVSNGAASAPSNTVTPATVPDAPTAVVASAGSGRVTVSFSAPASNGGSAITGYTATCGAQSQSGAGSPIVVTGLTNGVAVSCTVIATNGIGNSAASAPSGSVTPSEGIFANGFE